MKTFKLSWLISIVIAAFLLWGAWHYYDRWIRTDFSSSRLNSENLAAWTKYSSTRFHSGDVTELKRIKEQNDINGTLSWQGNDYGTWDGVIWSFGETGKRVTALNLPGKKLTGFMDVSKLSGLEDLRCEKNQLTGLNVASLHNLRKLMCNNNRLDELDVSKLTNLTYLNCKENRLSVLDVTNLTKLDVLSCGNNMIDELDVSKLTSLTWFGCSDNHLGTLNAENLRNLKTLLCKLSGLTELKLPSHGKLERLECEYNWWLKILDVSGHPNLRKLNCGNNNLSVLNIGNLNNIEAISCSYNQLTELDLTGAVNLKVIFCNNNQLTKLNIVGLSKLNKIYCFENKLEELDMSGLTGLKNLQCYSNELTKLNLTDTTGLAKVDCYSNKLEELDVRNLTGLEELWCFDNKLYKLNVSGAAELQKLDCRDNKLNELDVSGLSKLQRLYCEGNNLSELDVSGLSELKELWCGNNELTKLNLTGAAGLNMLNCKHNKLAELDMTGVSKLEANFEGNSLKVLRIAPESKIGGLFSLKKGESLKFLSPRQLKAEYNGPVTAQSLPDGTLVTAWRATESTRLTPRHSVPAPDDGFNRFDFYVRSDGTDIHSLAGVALAFKSIATSGEDAGTIDLETAEEIPNRSLNIDDFKLDTRAFVQFGKEGFNSISTAPISLDMEPQCIYAVVSSNSGVERRYRIDVNVRAVEENMNTPNGVPQVSDSDAALLIVSQMHDFIGSISLLSYKRGYVTPYEVMPELEAKLAQPGSVESFIKEYHFSLEDDNLADYFFVTKETKKTGGGKTWLIGRDLSKESDGVKQALKKGVRLSYYSDADGICDENLKPYSGGNAIYMVTTF